MIKAGEIRDSKTIAALTQAYLRYDASGPARVRRPPA
jgi:hypothetical protein